MGARPRVRESRLRTEVGAVTYWLWPPSRRPPFNWSPWGASRLRPVPAPEGLWRPNGLPTPATSEPARAPSRRKRATRVRKDGLLVAAGGHWGACTRPAATASRPFPARLRSDARNSSTEQTALELYFPTLLPTCLSTEILTCLLEGNVPYLSKSLFMLYWIISFII